MFVSSKTRSCRAEFLYIERPPLVTDKTEQLRRCTKLYSPVLNGAFSNPLPCPVLPAMGDPFFFSKLTAMNGWVLTRIQKLGFILRWSSYSIMNPVYEKDLRSLECRQILNSLQVCHSGFLRNEPAYQSFQRLCVICQLISIRFTHLTRVLL